MKVIFNKKDLLNSLVPAMGAVSTKNTITTLEGVLIETLGGNTVRLSTYDMTKGIRSTFEALEVVEEGAVIINAQRFLQIVRLLGGDEVTLSVDDKYNGTISSDTSSFSVFALRGADFPALPELSGKRGFEISGELIKNKINRVIHSVAEQENRPALCGVFFKIDGNRLEMVSCDGFSLSICKMVCDIKDIGEESSEHFSFILPGASLSELVKLLSENGKENIQVILARKHAIIKMGGMLFFTRMIDTAYVDYEKLIPQGHPITVKVNRERLLEGLERANLIADEKIQGSSRSYVKFIVNGQMVELSSTSVNGRVHDVMPCAHEGEDLQIAFNCRYLISNIRAAEGEEIILSLKNANQSMTIEPANPKESETFFYMLLPVRMTSAQ
ncbi:MAG: DNA polymerase III subunit beta [Clostridia bacterium]|nr:DNA polymerase III subunit beta [Clostridia bacterium]